jgi:hypothetical protein
MVVQGELLKLAPMNKEARPNMPGLNLSSLNKCPKKSWGQSDDARTLGHGIQELIRHGDLVTGNHGVFAHGFRPSWP